jgi:hypothetical protein
VEVVGQFPGVLLGAADEAGATAAEELRTQEVDARCAAHHAAVVDDPTPAVEDGEVQPGVVGPVAAGPDDRADLAPAEVDGQGRGRDRRRGEPLRRVDLAVESGGAGPGVEGVEEAVQLEVGQLGEVGQRPGELGHTAGDPPEAADDADPVCPEGVEVEGDPLRAPDQLG